MHARTHTHPAMNERRRGQAVEETGFGEGGRTIEKVGCVQGADGAREQAACGHERPQELHDDVVAAVDVLQHVGRAVLGEL